MSQSSTPLFCLFGPTATGKTALAIELAQKLPLEIVSVDSAMVYREMDIGTAKPSMAELAIAPHYLIDIRDASESYSVGEFLQDLQFTVEKIRSNGNWPLLVGGTMMYFYALQQGLADLPASDPAAVRSIQEKGRAQGWPALHAELMQVDPVSAEKITVNDSQRITRALALFQATGTPLSTWLQEHRPQYDYRFTNFILTPNSREELHQKIEQRLKVMWQQGFVEEVKGFFQRSDMHKALPSMRSVGYRQVWEYLEGNSSLAEMEQKALAATRQFAKRQCTWLNKWPDVSPYFSGDDQNIDRMVKVVASELEK